MQVRSADHLTIIVSDLSIAAGPQTRPDGIRQIYLHDPDNHLVELFSC